MKYRLLTLLLFMLTTNANTWAGDAQAGKEKSQVCAQCHGETGNKPIAYYPILAGQEEKYLLKALKDYKNGGRNDPVMIEQVKNLSNDDLADLAAYFSLQAGNLQ